LLPRLAIISGIPHCNIPRNSVTICYLKYQI